MFQRGGRKKSDSGVAQGLAEAASAITSGLGEAAPPSGHGATNNSQIDPNCINNCLNFRT